MSTNIFQIYAPIYWSHGLPVIPLVEREKRPAISAWTNFGKRMPDADEQTAWLGSFPSGNIGLPLGKESGICVIDIDTDDETLIGTIREICGPSPWERVGKKGMVLAYRFAGLRNFKLKTADGVTLCEHLGQGNQVVVPPSIHPDTGQPYTANCELWDVEGELSLLPADVEQRLRKALGLTTSRRGASPERSNVEPGGDSALHRLLQDRLDKRVAEVAGVKKGDRNNALFRNAAAMANDVAAADVGWTPYASALWAAAQEAGQEDHRIEGTLASAWSKGSITPTSWIKVAHEWIYVAGSDQFRHLESGSLLKRTAFRTEFAGINPGGKIMFDDYLTRHSYIQMVQEIAHEPQLQHGVIEKGGRKWYNNYLPSKVVAMDGDFGPFVEYLTYLVPDEGERKHLLKMLAHLVRKPGEKLAHALLLGSKVHGVGKSTLVQILEQLMGSNNCRKATSDELASQFQGYIDGTLLVTIEELDIGSGLRVYNKLKDLITAETSPMRKLYENAREVRNMATFFFLTNLDVPLLIEPSDRRFFVIQSPAQKQPEEYWIGFNQWWRNSLGIIRYFLDQVDLSDFDRFAPPPMTAAKDLLIGRSRSPVVQELLEMIAERAWPFRVDIVTRVQVEDALKRRDPRVRRSDVDRALSEIGAVNLGQHRLPQNVPLRGWSSSTAEKPTLWAVRNMIFWQQATTQGRVMEYLAETTTAPQLSDGVGLVPLCPFDDAGTPLTDRPRSGASALAEYQVGEVPA